MPDRAPNSLLHTAFYRFVPISDPRSAADALGVLGRALRGSIVVAHEGINGALAGEPRDVGAFEAALQRTDVLGGALQGTVFKHSGCATTPFGLLKISVKPEIVALTLPRPLHATIAAPDEHDASHLSPPAWRALLSRDDVVILDNRNHFEYRLGHFRGAIDPQVHNFRDFAAFVEASAPAWRAAGRPVAMYCTGGVRCDKTAPWMRSLGLDVWQLDGGVLNYFRNADDADRDWVGECFVFDNRVAIDSALRETATTAEQVFDARRPDELWRLQRARRLADPAGSPRSTRASALPRAEPTWTPPLRDGVAASRVGVGASRFASVLDFLVARFPAVGDWPARLAHGDVLDAAGRPLGAEAACLPGTLIWYWRNPPPERRVPFEIDLLYQDEHLVVVDKPHFLPTMPGGRHLQETVLVRLKRQLGIATLAPMHRLDRDTAGVLVFTVQPGTREPYQSLLRDRRVRKVYEAVAPWRPDLPLPLVCRHRLEQRSGADFMQMAVVPGEPNAETHIESIRIVQGTERDSTAPVPGILALYRLTPTTGRKHQLRAQLSALGLPIVGDRLYPHLLPEPPADAEPDYSRPLQLLAREFSFRDPISGEQRRFSSRRTLLPA